MHRKFIAAVVAAAMLITGLSAAPARADSDDLARALAAIAGLAIVGTVIKNRNDRRDEKRNEVSRGYTHDPAPRHSLRPKHTVKPRPLPQRVSRNLLPGDCLRSYNTRDGRIRMFNARCLDRNFVHADRLPDRCFREVRTRDGRRRGYEARCLRDRGYELARR